MKGVRRCRDRENGCYCYARILDGIKYMVSRRGKWIISEITSIKQENGITNYRGNVLSGGYRTATDAYQSIEQVHEARKEAKNEQA